MKGSNTRRNIFIWFFAIACLVNGWYLINALIYSSDEGQHQHSDGCHVNTCEPTIFKCCDGEVCESHAYATLNITLKYGVNTYNNVVGFDCNNTNANTWGSYWMCEESRSKPKACHFDDRNLPASLKLSKVYFEWPKIQVLYVCLHVFSFFLSMIIAAILCDTK